MDVSIDVNDDIDLDLVVAAWGRGEASGDLTAVASAWRDSLVGYCVKRNPTLSRDDDLPGAAMVWVLERMRAWRDGEGSARGWLASGFTWFLSEYNTRQDDLPNKTWHRVLAAASVARHEAAAAGRVLTMKELAEATRVRLEASLLESITRSNPDLDAAKARAEARARLTKDGVSAALASLPEILATGDSQLRLDQPLGTAEDSMTLGDTLVANGEQGGSEDRVDEVTAIMLGDQVWARQALAARAGSDAEGSVESSTYQALAEEAGRSVDEVKAVLKLAKSRVRAAHAQWAYLAEASLIRTAEPTDMFADA